MYFFFFFFYSSKRTHGPTTEYLLQYNKSYVEQKYRRRRRHKTTRRDKNHKVVEDLRQISTTLRWKHVVRVNIVVGGGGETTTTTTGADWRQEQRRQKGPREKFQMPAVGRPSRVHPARPRIMRLFPHFHYRSRSHSAGLCRGRWSCGDRVRGGPAVSHSGNIILSPDAPCDDVGSDTRLL